MGDADLILHVKTGELNADVLIADVIRKLNFRKMNLLYLLILYGDRCSNFAWSIAPQKSCIIQKIKNSIMPKSFFQENSIFEVLKYLALYNFLTFCTMLAYVVCNIIQWKKLGVTVLLFDLRSMIYHFWVNFIRECCHSNVTLVTKTALIWKTNAKMHEQFNTSLSKVNSAKN